VEKDGRQIVYETVADLPDEKKEGLNLFVYAHLPYFVRQIQQLREKNA
jgi:hypothetical protein